MPEHSESLEISSMPVLTTDDGVKLHYEEVDSGTPINQPDFNTSINVAPRNSIFSLSTSRSRCSTARLATSST